MTPTQRAMRARIAAHSRWAECSDRTAATQRARDALSESWLRKADPDGVLSPEARAQRAESLRKAHYTRMALKSAQARSRGRKG